MGNILTDPSATYAASATLVTTKVDAEVRTDPESATLPIANWATEHDDAVTDVNEWIVGTSSAGIAGNTMTCLGSVAIEQNLDLDSASPTLTLGDNTGAPRLILDAVASSDGAIDWEQGSVLRWRLFTNSSAEWRLHRYNASGVFQDNPILVDPTAGDVAFASDITVAGGLFALTGTSTPTIRIDKTPGSTGILDFSTDGSTQWVVRNTSTENFEIERNNPAGTPADIPFAIAVATGNVTFANDISAVDGTFTGIVDMQGAYCDLPTNSGAPTAVTARMYYDTLDNIAYIYNGTVWKALYA